MEKKNPSPDATYAMEYLCNHIKTLAKKNGMSVLVVVQTKFPAECPEDFIKVDRYRNAPSPQMDALAAASHWLFDKRDDIPAECTADLDKLVRKWIRKYRK